MGENCPHHADLAEAVKSMNKKLDTIIESMGTGSIAIAELKLRVLLLERIVFGAVGIVLLSVIGAALAVILGK
jgi:hypothetical protein